jgi:hypothetical protein
MFVQFPHPGPEHLPDGPTMDWNRGEHARKFLRATGRYLHGGAEQTGPVSFWGEWEPQSRVVDSFPKEGDGPRWLHEPTWQVPRHRKLLRNTDPMVFGDRFLYTNCRQGSNGKLRELARGSVVLFGSKLRSAFVLDTVFVVGGGEAYTRGSVSRLDVEPWLRAVIFDPLERDGEPPDEPFRMYRSLTYDERPGGPYSFVPCRPDGPRATFARPAIELDARWINPDLSRGAKATEATASDLEALWDDVVQQVRAQGLARGIQFDAPPERPSEPDLPADA